MEEKDRDKDPFEGVADAIAEGRSVDWDAIRTAVGSPSPKLRNFELLQGIAQAFHAENETLAPLPASPPPQGPLPPKRNGNAASDSTGADRTVSSDPKDSGKRSPTLFTWGALLVLEEIGEGAFAKVYRAYDPTLDCEVALKLRREDAPRNAHTVNKFIDEARMLAKIRHPHVLKVHGANVHNNRVGIWEYLVRGKTLARLVKEDGPFSANEAILIGMDLCCALASLHANNLVHRDIKPSNVMRENGHIWLMDFGSAGDLKDLVALRQTFSGTPVTTAPEVLVDCEAPTPASDIYSLGVLLYWLVSGRYPIEADGLSALVQMHKRGELRPLLDVRPDVDRAFAQVVERALAHDPRQRFASMGELQHALARVLAPVRPPDAFNLRTWLRKHRRAAGIVATSVAIAAAAVGVLRWYYTPIRVETTLYRQRGGNTEVLENRALVRGGDEIFLEMRGKQETYAWVVHEDSKGTARFLFPIGEENPPAMAPDRTYHLPFQGKQQMNWQIDAEGDAETLLVVASRRRLPFMAQQIAATRGWTLVPVVPDARANLIEQLHGQLRNERGVWVQTIVLKKDAAPFEREL